MFNFGVTLIRNSNLGVVNSYALFKVRLNLTGIFIQFLKFPLYIDTKGLPLQVYLLAFLSLIVLSLGMNLKISQLSMFMVGNLNAL